MPTKSEPNPALRFIVKGVKNAFLNFVYGSVLFAIFDEITLHINSPILYGKPSFSDIDPAFSALWAVFLFLFGLILGLLPAGVVGAILASWLYKENKQVSMMVTFGRGLLIGGFSLVPVIILLFLTWPQAHGIPVYNNPVVFKVFFFRAITSVVIAALAGGRTGVQLAQQISGDQIIQS